MDLVLRRLPYMIPFLKLFAHKSRCRPTARLIELAGQFTGDVIPEEGDNLLQSRRCDGRWAIDKYVPQNIRGPVMYFTYMTLDGLQQPHDEMPDK
jgi:hypothetical protein